MTASMFINEITSLLTERYWETSTLTLEKPPMQIMQYYDTMEALRLEQHVQSPTHRLENTLDLIFTQLHGEVKVTNATTHGYISDQCMVSIGLQWHKLRHPKIKKTIRDKTRMTAEALLTNFTALTLDTNDSLDQTCHRVNTELHNALEKTVCYTFSC